MRRGFRRRARAGVLALGALARGPLALGALPRKAVADDADMGRRLQEALRAQHGEIHGCYAEALSRDPQAKGELLIRLRLAEGGRVRQAEVLKDQSSAGGLAACLTERMGRWVLPGLRASAGDDVVFPLVFRPDEASAPPAQTAPSAAAPAVKVSPELAVVEVAPGKRAPQPDTAAHRVLYVLSGRGQAWWTGQVPLLFGTDDALLVPAGTALTVQAGGAPLRLLQVSVAGAPGVQAPRRPRAALIRGATVPMLPLANGGCQVRILIDAARARACCGLPEGMRQPASLELLTCAQDVAIPRHQHDDADELLYVIAGAGQMTLGPSAGRPDEGAADVPVVAGDRLRIPRGTPHAVRVSAPLRAVQSYTPAGPEQRFRNPPERR